MSKAENLLLLLEDFTDYPPYYSKGSIPIGYVFIKFREGGKHDVAKSEYILNSMGDTWFRKVEDHPKGTKGYGLAIQDLKVTSKTPMQYGRSNAYKASIKYTPVSDENTIETASVWLYIYNEYELKDVLKYINLHKNKWKP